MWQQFFLLIFEMVKEIDWVFSYFLLLDVLDVQQTRGSQQFFFFHVIFIMAYSNNIKINCTANTANQILLWVVAIYYWEQLWSGIRIWEKNVVVKNNIFRNIWSAFFRSFTNYFIKSLYKYQFDSKQNHLLMHIFCHLSVSNWLKTFLL